MTTHGTVFIRAAIFAAGAFAALALFAAPAGAATTYRFFSKQTSQQFLDPSGKPITDPNAQPVAGDQFISTDLDYVGNHKHHAKHWTVTDHLACTITSTTPTGALALCNGQFAIGGSLLIAENENVTFNFASASTTVVPVNAGTGKFRHAKGTVRSTDIGNSNNSDVVIKLH
ncbi:MAG TPA: hypothetical protein VGI67_21055 [Thermoleophilaceae bacterium]